MSAINVAIQDTNLQAPEAYRDLFIELVRMNRAVRYQGERRLLLATAWEDETDNRRLLGILDRFTDLDAFNWYNREERRAATPEERAQINVPEIMRANYRGFYVTFDLRLHRLAFLAYEAGAALSARQVAFVITDLVSDARIVERFGSVTVAIEQEPAALDRILNAPHLRYISISVNRPNGSFGGLEDEWRDQMDALQAKTLRYEATADDRGSLRPNETIRNAAEVALGNGVVDAKIFENGITETVSTEDSPMSETITYSPDGEPQVNAFRRGAAALFQRVADLLRRR